MADKVTARIEVEQKFPVDDLAAVESRLLALGAAVSGFRHEVDCYYVDVRSLGPADSQTGYRDPVEGIRRIEVKGRTRGYSIRLTTNEWYKATQLGDTYWLYVVWDPLGPKPEMLVIRNPAAKLDHAKKEIVVARYYEIPADAIRHHGQPLA